MTARHPSIAPETLLSHRAWMCSLARSLVRDDAQAEDVVQDAMVIALRSPPTDRQALPAWLATVVRNAAKQLWRGETRRSAREATSARAEVASSAEVAVARAEEHALVVQAVMSLDEPYRSTILLRFFEEQSVAVVAERTGVPRETAKTRIRRGLARLRERLDAAHGGDGATWKRALVPLFASPAPPVVGGGAGAGSATVAKSIGGGLAMATTGTTVAASVALALGLTAGWWFGQGANAAPPNTEAGRADAVVDASPVDSQERARASRRQSAELAAVTAALETSRGEVAQLRERVAELESPAEASTTEPRERGRQAFLFEEYPKLGEVDWTVVGARSREMIESLRQIQEAARNGEAPSVELIGSIRRQNSAFIDATYTAARELPGEFANSTWLHPVFVANEMAAILDAGGAPLSPAQTTALDRETRESSEEDKRLRAEYDGRTPIFRKLHDEAALRTAYVESALATLTPEQRELLIPTSVRGTIRFSKFNDGSIWRQVLESIAHVEGDSSVFASGVTSALDGKLHFSQEQREIVSALASDWARELPYTTLVDTAGPHSAERARTAARHTLALLERIDERLAFEGTQLDAYLAWDAVLLPSVQTD